MSNEADTTDDADIGHTLGQDNIQIFGLDIHNPVFLVSAILVLALVVCTLIFQEQSEMMYIELNSWVTTRFDAFFLISANSFVLFCFFLAFSPYGRIRLGGPQATPRYNYPAWLAMLFAAGVGIGLMFFGVLEPVTHTLNPPLGIDPENTPDSRAVGMSAAIFHWGLHAWAIYAIVGLALAFFSFNRGMPLTLRSAFYPIIGKAVWGPFGHMVDTIAVLATVFGLATSLGFGAEQIAAGLNYLFSIEDTTSVKIMLIVFIISIALVSVVAGLDRGVKRLSELNMGLAGLLLLFVLVAGPTLTIIYVMVQATIDYLFYLPQLSNWVGRDDQDFLHTWTIFYWAWWISWSPFVGMFIARVSFGRTVREFIIWVLVIPTIIGIIWMSTFGGNALDQLLNHGYEGVANAVPELALFKMLEVLPLTGVVSAVSVILITIFFVTSADSGSLVIDTITAGGKMDAPVQQRVFWCISTGLVSIALLLGGGMASLQALTTSIGLPFCFILLLMCVSIMMGLLQESRK